FGAGVAAERLVERDIYGVTPQGEFGLRHQLDRLEAHRLRAVFFVEALSALVIGRRALEGIVGAIQKAGCEVQLHLHPEWLPFARAAGLPAWKGDSLKAYAPDEQEQLIRIGIDTLRACGAHEISALRAGNFGADAATLRAAARAGIRFDSSYDAEYLD